MHWRRPSTKSLRRFRRRRSRNFYPARTCSASRRPAPAKPRRSPCRSCSDSRKTVRRRDRTPCATLILAPTRELAIQIGEDFASYGEHLNLRFATIFGGVGQNPQAAALKRGVDVLIATPGRLLDLVSQRLARLDKVSMLVLDEADRLLDMGFIRDVKRIVSLLPKARQSLLFSATMPTEVAPLAREILRDPVRIDVSPKTITVDQTDQHVVFVENNDKRHVLTKLLRDPLVTRAIVFTRTKHGANRVTEQLDRAGINAEAIHGNKSQNARQRALEQFKTGKAGCWSRRISPRAASTSTRSATCSTSNCRTSPRATCIGLDVPAAPAHPVPRLRCAMRPNGRGCARSSG